MALIGRARRSAAIALAAGALIATLLAPGTALGAVTLTPVASGLDSPVFVTNAGDGIGRLFIVEQAGQIRIVKNGVLLPTPFLDISDRSRTGSEQGLLGLAFHPSYETNGKFYVDYTDARRRHRRSASTASIRRTRTSRDPLDRRDDPATIGQPYANHNGGMLAFGPDGYLYIGMGDGGSGGDPGNRAQSMNTLLGKILRIDVNGVGPAAGTTGSRPATRTSARPAATRSGRSGLRNPWRFSFDRRPATCGSATSARTATRRSTARPRPRRRPRRQLRLAASWRAGTATTRRRGCTDDRQDAAGRRVHAHARAARSPAATSTAGPRPRALTPLRLRRLLHRAGSGRIPTSAAGDADDKLLIDTASTISSFGEDEAGELYVVDLGGTVYRLNVT